jgi:type 1 glutamine amidotransferase
MEAKKALFVGGAKAPYHLLEPTIEPVATALDEVGLSVTTSGIYHPQNPETPEGDYTSLNRENLEPYDALVLFTTGQGNGEDTEAVLEFVRSGKALIGIHCATDSFVDNSDYIAAMGGRFRTHPAPLDITVDIVDSDHPVTRGMRSCTVHDELYLFQDYDPDRVHLLAETRSYGDEGPIPIAWVRSEGAGRIFYISLGHFPEVMHDPHWRTFLQRGTQWALGTLE